ncbi:MAG: hypothetical protein J4F45_14320 [Pseudomonadales bacterium]|nr:hypothetical protein [Pseudomonadales bacterium]
MGGEDGGELHHDDVVERQRRVQMDRHVSVIERFHVPDEVEVHAGLDLFAPRVQREHHVIAGDGNAITPTGVGVNPKHDSEAVVGYGDAVGEAPVERADLVAGPNEQRVGTKAEPRRHADAPHDERRKIVERAGGRQHQRAALGRIGIHIVEMGEVARILELVEESNAVGEGQLVDVDPGTGRTPGRRQPGDEQKPRHPRCGLPERLTSRHCFPCSCCEARHRNVDGATTGERIPAGQDRQV